MCVYVCCVGFCVFITYSLWFLQMTPSNGKIWMILIQTSNNRLCTWNLSVDFIFFLVAMSHSLSSNESTEKKAKNKKAKIDAQIIKMQPWAFMLLWFNNSLNTFKHQSQRLAFFSFFSCSIDLVAIIITICVKLCCVCVTYIYIFI